MSRYIVHVIQHNGDEGYLSHGKIVRLQNAMIYCSPSAARRALAQFAAKHHTKGGSLVPFDRNRKPARQREGSRA